MNCLKDRWGEEPQFPRMRPRDCLLTLAWMLAAAVFCVLLALFGGCRPQPDNPEPKPNGRNQWSAPVAVYAAEAAMAQPAPAPSPTPPLPPPDDSGTPPPLPPTHIPATPPAATGTAAPSGEAATNERPGCADGSCQTRPVLRRIFRGR